MGVRTNIAAIAGATAAGMAGGALLAARQISGPRQRPALAYTLTPFEVGAKAESVTFTASDGTRLAGWWFDRASRASTGDGRDDTNRTPHGDPRGPGAGRDQGAPEQVVILCHGHRGDKSDLLGIGPGLWRAGYSVLVFDFRGNGDSADGPQSLAHYEQRDLEAAIDFAAARKPDAELDVLGYSMGAAVALLVAARDQRIAKVVADSAFADMHGVISAAARGLRLPPVPLVSLVDHATRLRYGYRFNEVQPVDVVAQIAPRPLLLIHGTNDKVIPLEHAHRLAEAAGEGSQLRLVETEHCGAYFTDRPGYIETVAGFLRA